MLPRVQKLPDLAIHNWPAKSLVRLDHVKPGNTVHLVARLAGDNVAALYLYYEGGGLIHDPEPERFDLLRVVSRSTFSLDFVPSLGRNVMAGRTSLNRAVVPLVCEASTRNGLQAHLSSLGREAEFPVIMTASLVATDLAFLEVLGGPTAVDMIEQAYLRLAEALPNVLDGSYAELVEMWRARGEDPFEPEEFKLQSDVVCTMTFLSLTHGVTL